MIAQALISILIVFLIIIIGYKMIYKPWVDKNLTPEKLEAKKIELERKKEILEEMREEIDVEKELSKIDMELTKLNERLEKAVNKRLK